MFNNPLKYTDPSGYKASEIADIGAGPMWYQLFGSELTPSWLNVDVGNFYSGDFAGGFDEAIGGDGDKKKKSSSARRPKPSKNKTRRCFEWNSLDDANGSSGLGPVDPYRNIEFDNEKVINDLSDFDDGTQPSRRVNPAGGSAGGGVDATAYAGGALGVGSEFMFSDKFGTWMGKDGKIRSQNWGGNGTTGGKFKFAGKVSKGFKIGGWVSGAYGMYSTNTEWQNNQISTGQMMIEQGSNVLGFIPTYGTAWSIGWNLGQDFGPSTWYGKNDYKWFE